jgi:triacylglycerol lipase
MFSEHMLLLPLSAPMALRWLTDRFTGKPLSDNLIRTKWPRKRFQRDHAASFRMCG